MRAGPGPGPSRTKNSLFALPSLPLRYHLQLRPLHFFWERVQAPVRGAGCQQPAPLPRVDHHPPGVHLHALHQHPACEPARGHVWVCNKGATASWSPLHCHISGKGSAVLENSRKPALASASVTAAGGKLVQCPGEGLLPLIPSLSILCKVGLV